MRERIIPSAKAYPFDALLADCRAYFQITGPTGSLLRLRWLHH